MHFKVGHWLGELLLPVWNDWAPVGALVFRDYLGFPWGLGLVVVMVLPVAGVGANFIVGSVVPWWILLLPSYVDSLRL